jgi:hypothetical protein
MHGHTADEGAGGGAAGGDDDAAADSAAARRGDRLPGALPLICAPGNMAMVDRNALHAPFANTSGATTGHHNGMPFCTAIWCPCSSLGAPI